MSEQCHAFVFVPFLDTSRGRRRCRNLTTHRSGLCWVHRHPAMIDDLRTRGPGPRSRHPVGTRR